MYVYNTVVYSQGLGNCRISLCSFGSRLSMKGTVSKIVHRYLVIWDWVTGTPSNFISQFVIRRRSTEY